MTPFAPILVVDNDEEDRYLILEAFTQINKAEQVLFFSSGNELLNYLNTLPEASRPSLIVLDYNMPLLNGSDTLKRIREHGLHSKVPVVVFSSGFLPHVAKELKALNALTLLQKGNKFSKLVEQARYFSELIADDVETLLGNY